MKGLPLCCDTIQHLEAPYATYDLQSSIGPIATSENLSIADWLDVPTTAGLFTITQMTDNTFQAIVGSSVPEPSSAWMLISAAAGLCSVRRFRRS